MPNAIIRPRIAKTHSNLVAAEYVRLGWTLVSEFRALGDCEPAEYYFEWQHEHESVPVDWTRFELNRNAAK
jgi:hypothetical protein